MLSRLELAIDLLHSASDAGLATHSSSLPGFPFASSIPFIVDEHQRPVFLISALAEHTRNLAANSRASLMIAKPLGEGEVARISLVGEVHSIDRDPGLMARYLRYHPHAERFLQLGDFRFHRLDPIRVLTIGGFARASWLEGERLLEAPSISLEQEAALIDRANVRMDEAIVLSGVDPYGADLLTDRGRIRIRFGVGPVAEDALLPTLLRELEKPGGLTPDPAPGIR
ncbi:MAG: pyridoxamine 5'-phosphate oxidase family protein [Rhodocyclales bacterium]|nr:pyridoxamine 5'-phosphate oxidase family protein [Rhodocyclales bacterium]